MVEKRPSVEEKNSATSGILKRCWKRVQTSGRMPLPNMHLILCVLSRGDGGAARRYRAVSPT